MVNTLVPTRTTPASASADRTPGGMEIKATEAEPNVAANLDTLRAIAVLLVLMDHVLDSITHKHPSVSFHPYDWAAGRLGVLLFFVHTSLVLNFSMARLQLNGWSLIRSFLIRRAFRIYPLSLLCVASVLVFDVPRMPWEEYIWRGWGNALSNLALTTNLTFSQPVIGPLWSLPVEAQMYVTLPIIFMLIGARRSLRVAALLWMLSAIVALLQPSVSDRLNVLSFAPCFMSGVLAFSLSRQEKNLPAKYWLPFLMGLIGIYLAIQGFTGDAYSSPLQWSFCLAVGLLLPRFKDSTFRPLNTAVHVVAKYSYGIYLFHCIALWIACFRLTMLPEAAQWIVAAALLTVMSVASFHILEKPATNLGARLASRTKHSKTRVKAIAR